MQPAPGSASARYEPRVCAPARRPRVCAALGLGAHSATGQQFAVVRRIPPSAVSADCSAVRDEGTTFLPLRGVASRSQIVRITNSLSAPFRKERHV